jgi:hypothetical protein
MTTGLVEIAARSGASLKLLIKEDYKTVEDVPFLLADSWIRSSGFPSLCPREEVLCANDKVPRTWEISADLNLIFQHGHGLHHQLQNEIMPAIGVIRGKWVCLGCGGMHGGEADRTVRVETWAEERPASCPGCESTAFTFHEVQMLNDEYRISGHCDGFLEMEGVPGMGILEGKSIMAGWEVQNVPKLDHVIQLQTYMWLADLQWGIILYWQKGENGIRCLIEHFVERDEDTIDNIKSTLKSIWDGVDGGDLPEKLCEKYGCKRAKSCVVRDKCFGKLTDESK